VSANSANLYLGCISGTSVDGLDMALIRMSESQQIDVLHASTAPFSPEFRTRLLQLGQPGQDDLDLLGYCDSDLGAFIGEAMLAFLHTHDFTAEDITAVGSHGQTVRHRPPDAQHPYGFTTQIGDPNRIAEITGIQTLADFRRRDMAAGGQGAPLVPPFHQALFQREGDHVAVLNIGGISNVSLLGSPPSGFDTGPGNAIMDAWCEQHRSTPYDQGGDWAASGSIDADLLQRCLADPYFAAPPPKSTGREYFNLAWLSHHVDATFDPADVQATLCELTARCTADALARWAPQTKTLIACGGGRLNRTLMANLARHTSARVGPSEEWNVDGDSIEAALFAWLAYRTLKDLPGNEPAVTGARGYRTLGAIYPS